MGSLSHLTNTSLFNRLSGRLLGGFNQERILIRLFFICAIVGIVAGLGAIAFYYLLDLAKHFFLDFLAGYHPSSPNGELSIFSSTNGPYSSCILALLPMAGGLIGGLLVNSFCPEAEGHGTDRAIAAYHYAQGKVRVRVPLIKTIASCLTIGAGGSAGREGPIAQIGAGFGSQLAKFLKLSVRERRILLAAGMGAGIGAIFRAPLAGALFVAEVMYLEMDFEYEVIVPTLLSAIVAYCTFSLFFGWQPIFTTPEFSFYHPTELFTYSILALVVAGGARIYVRVFYGIREVFMRLRIWWPFKPALGGLVVGGLGVLNPHALATGFGELQQAFYGTHAGVVALATGAMKILTTAFTVGSGGSGGVFGPAVVIGGLIGEGCGHGLKRLFPSLIPNVGAYALVGMAGFFGAAAHSPISTVIMVSELTGSYRLLIPCTWVCMIAFFLQRTSTIYESQLPTRLQSPAHFHQAVEAVLGGTKVIEALVMRPKSTVRPLRESDSLSEVLERLSESESGCLPVVNDQQALVGEVIASQVQSALVLGKETKLLIAKDLMEAPVKIYLQDTLLEAMRVMNEHRRRELLVFSNEKESQIVDVLNYADIGFLLENHQRPAEDDPTPFSRSVFRVWLRQWTTKKNRDA